ncbi:tol-pal system-associated acyl-CoA thioesterase [Roseibium suaedae]|uniref:Acyl-CoA thioester hydrolase n=1 Tax=Roseibium suaedae TaxID=735517 RepID=A0A1M7IPQ2_9HYPH|nr:tol-pal system-associated acyl-CoA thioesterase [Roseibium suaedae]SHM42347.1 acyl-CoA thioester hydrolase [Roseibium suaedae]
MTDWPDLAGRFESGAHVLPVRVYYEDTDFTGVVYHGAFIKFFERGRSDYLRLCEVHHTELQNADPARSLAFAVRRMSVEFMRPARIDDVLEVHTSLVEARGARLELRQEIRRSGDVLITADVLVAVINGQGRPARLPKDIMSRLEHLART